MLGEKDRKKILFFVLGCFEYNKTLGGFFYLKCTFNVSPSLPGFARSPPDILEEATNS